MDTLITEAIAQWGSFGILIAFAIWIIYNHIKDNWDKKNNKQESSKPQTSNDLLITTLITNLSNKFDKLDTRIDILENNMNIRIGAIETRLAQQPKNFINHINKLNEEKAIEHNKAMIDQMKLGPELHDILSKYKIKINSDHIFLGSFHNGTTNISGIPYCKFDIIAEKFSPDEVGRDVEFAFMYRNADILRHNKLPITVLQEEMVHYVIDENGNSELSEIDDIIYRRMVGRDIKQLAFHILRDGNRSPSGFVGCVRYDYENINLQELNNCAKELEIIYRNSGK